MISAFGVDHGGIGTSQSGVSKAESSTKRNRRGTAVVGAGAVAGGTGLIAGGVPKAKSDSTAARQMGRGKGVRSSVRGATKIAPGGILGFRSHAHGGGIYGFKQKHTEAEWSGPAKSKQSAFYRGYNYGKIEPEMKVIRGLAQGRRAANAALVGGAATVAGGLAYRRKHKVSKGRRESDTYNAALVGAGGTGAALTHTVPRFLRTKEKKYAVRAAGETARSNALAPSLAGRRTGEVRRKPHLLKGVPRHAAQEAGRLRGAAAQHEHFAEVLGGTAKAVGRFRTPTTVAAGIGAGGLLATAHRKKG